MHLTFTYRRAWRAHGPARPLALLAAGAVVASLAACSSPSVATSTSSAALYGTAIKQQCTAEPSPRDHDPGS